MAHHHSELRKATAMVSNERKTVGLHLNHEKVKIKLSKCYIIIHHNTNCKRNYQTRRAAIARINSPGKTVNCTFAILPSRFFEM